MVSLFDSSADIEVAAEAANGAELLLKLQMTQVDLLLLDLDMPGENGMELIRHIKRDYPDLPILILSMHDEVCVVSRAIQAGAAGYLCKDCAPKTLIEAVHKTMDTGKFLDQQMAEQLAYATPMQPLADAASTLSDREMEVFRLLIEGNSNDTIARQLFISDRTVSAHKANLQNKLGLKNIVELVHYALRHKLFSTA